MAGMTAQRADMFIPFEEDPRPEPPPMADERATLLGFLRWHRATLELKCSGLSPAELARRSAEPSTMSLLGIVRHLAEAERGWSRRFMAGQDAPLLFCSKDEPDADFDGAAPDPETVARAWDAWHAEAAFTDELITTAPSLDTPGKKEDRHRGPMSLRWVLVHLIEEYARHNGHADLLRERIDGRIGQ
jgi:uncharacterized damage-inducible protein DinB